MLPGAGVIRLISPHNITMAPGETREITVTIRNVGVSPVNDLFSTPTPSSWAPFTVDFLRNSNRVFHLGVNGQRNIAMQVTVDENARPGLHIIAVSHYFSQTHYIFDESIEIMSSAIDHIGVTIEEERGEADIRLGGFQTTHAGALAPGQTFTVSANLQNIGDGLAEDVRITLPENRRADDDIFIISDLNNAIFAEIDDGDSNALSFTFQTSDDIETGAHTILFEVSFRLENSTMRRTESFPFIVNAYNPEESDAAPTIEIRGMTVPTRNVNVGENGEISFTVINLGDVEARNIRIEATVPGYENAIVPMTANIQAIPVLAPGESRVVSFTFSPRASAVTRSYAVRFRTGFDYGRTGEDSFDQFASFNVYNPEEDEEDDAAQIPRVIVSAHAVYPAVPRAGQEFELALTFRNTNANLSVNNIRVRLEEAGQTAAFPGQQTPFAGFVPVGGSDTLFVDALAPLGETSMTLRYTTSVDATPGTHNLRVHFEYQDQNFRSHEATQMITITLAQVTNLEISHVNMPETAMLGGSVFFSYTIINSGRVNLINVRIDTEGAFDVTEARGHRGNLNAQRQLDATGIFVPLEPGMQEGRFVVQGEDNVGAIVEAYHYFRIMVEGGDDFGFEGGDWDGAWVDDGGFGRPMPPGRFPDDGMMHFPGDDFGMGGADEPGFFARLFTQPVRPAEWNDDFFGPFTPENAAMMGFPVERGIRWIAVIAVGAVAIAAIAIPVAVVIIKKRNKVDFEDDE